MIACRERSSVMTPLKWTMLSRTITLRPNGHQSFFSRVSITAENVTGVKKVHDHLCWVDTMSGMYLNSPEDEDMAKAGSSSSARL